MVAWSEFERRAPEMAQAGKELLFQYGPGLAFLATVRKDGAPRLHPICPTVIDGSLYALILPTSPKCGAAHVSAERSGRRVSDHGPCLFRRRPCSGGKGSRRPSSARHDFQPGRSAVQIRHRARYVCEVPWRSRHMASEVQRLAGRSITGNQRLKRLRSSGYGPNGLRRHGAKPKSALPHRRQSRV
jgi:hypothetical protein